MNIGMRIEVLRKQMGLSRLQFGKFVDIHPQTLYRYEKNTRHISAENIKNIANYCNISSDWIIYGRAYGISGNLAEDLEREQEPELLLQERNFLSKIDFRPVVTGKPRIDRCLPRSVETDKLGMNGRVHKGHIEEDICGMDIPEGFSKRTTLRVSLPIDHSYLNSMFSVLALGNSMVPEGIKHGYVVFCDPEVEIKAGDAVYIEKMDGSASIKIYLKKDEQNYHLQGWSDPRQDRIQEPYFNEVPVSEVTSIACVVIVKRKT